MRVIVLGTKNKELKKIIMEAFIFYLSLLVKDWSTTNYKKMYIKLVKKLDGALGETDPVMHGSKIFMVMEEHPLKSLLKTLAHETVHVKQILEDGLFSGNYWKFKNKFYEHSEKNYVWFPWEKEAYRKQSILYNKYKNYLRKKIT